LYSFIYDSGVKKVRTLGGRVKKAKNANGRKRRGKGQEWMSTGKGAVRSVSCKGCSLFQVLGLDVRPSGG